MLWTACAQISFYPVQISNILVLTVYSSSLILLFRYYLFVPTEYMSFIPDTEYYECHHCSASDPVLIAIQLSFLQSTNFVIFFVKAWFMLLSFVITEPLFSQDAKMCHMI
jgi:hypothetical protein